MVKFKMHTYVFNSFLNLFILIMMVIHAPQREFLCLYLQTLPHCTTSKTQVLCMSVTKNQPLWLSI